MEVLGKLSVDKFLCLKKFELKTFKIIGSTGTEKCRFFIYDIRYNICELYNETITHHEGTCQFIGGPPLPSVDKCDIKDCSVR